MGRIVTLVMIIVFCLVFATITTAPWTGASQYLDRYLGKNYVWSVAHAQPSDTYGEIARWDHRAISFDSTGAYNQWAAEHEELLDSGELRITERHVDVRAWSTRGQPNRIESIVIFYKKLRVSDGQGEEQ